MRAVVFAALTGLCGWGFATLEGAGRLTLNVRIHRAPGVVQAESGDPQFTILLALVGLIALFCLAQCLSAIWDMVSRNGART